MKIAGYLLIGIGVLDFALGWMGVDITGFEESPLLFSVIGGFFCIMQKIKIKFRIFQINCLKGKCLLSHPLMRLCRWV